MQEATDRRVLFSTYYFPPGGGIGALRAYKFVKYLSEYGYEPVVYTTDRYYLNDVPPPGYSDDVSIDADINRIRPFPSSLAGNVIDSRIHSDIVKEKLSQVCWSIRAAFRVARDARSNNADLLYYTGGPFIPLYFARITGALSQTPYVVDLRDPWTLDLEYLDSHSHIAETTLESLASKILRKIDTSLEPPVLAGSAAVITPTERMTELYQNRYPDIAERVHTIHNGYDTDDFNTDGATDTHYESDSFTIVYPGEFEYGRREPDELFTALADLSCKFDIRFEHFGPIEDELVDLSEQYGLSDVVQFHGYTDRDEIARTLRGADLGLLVSTGREWELSLKVFDYVACDVPILYIGPGDETLSDFITQFTNAFACENDQDDIKTTLSRLLSDESPVRLSKRTDIEQYSRSSLTETLATLFDTVLNQRTAQ